MHLAIEAVGAKHSGAATVLLAIVNAALEEERITHLTVFCSPSRLREFCLPSAPRLRVEEPEWAEGSLGRPAWHLAGVSQALAAKGVDAVLMLNGAGLAPAGVRSTVFVQQALPYVREALASQEWRDRWRLQAIRYENMMACRSAQFVVVQSEWMREALCRELHVARSKIRVELAAPSMPGAVLEGNAIRRMRQAPPGKRVLYVGSEARHKNLGVLFGAMERLRVEDGEITLFATIGDGRSGGAEDGIVRLGRVAPAELWGLYAEASLIVMPSLVETVGLPLLEAAVAGVPITAADRPYAREVCGDGAAYFDPLNAEGCAREVRRLLTDEALRSRVSGNARARAEGRIARKPYRAMVRLAIQAQEDEARAARGQ